MWGSGKGGNEKWIGYAVNDMDNTISEIDYNDPHDLLRYREGDGEGNQ